MTSSNKQQLHTDEESLVQEIINKHNTISFCWLIFIFIVFVTIQSIQSVISILLLPSPSTVLPSLSLNLNHRISALNMFAFSVSMICILLYANHSILQNFKLEKLSDAATINYKLVTRSITLTIVFGISLLALFSIIDFMNPPF